MADLAALNDTAALKEYLLKPVSNGKPTGDPKQILERFQDIKTQVEDLKGEGKPEAWEQIVRTTAAFLHGTAKDLRVLSYLCDGLPRLQGVDGVLRSLVCLTALLEKYPNTLLPAKAFSRQRSVQGICDNLARVIGPLKPNPEELETLLAAVAGLQTAMNAEDVGTYDGEELSKLRDALVPSTKSVPGGAESEEDAIDSAVEPELTTLESELAEYVRIGSHPVSEELPAGEDISDSDAYQLLYDAYAAIDSPTRSTDFASMQLQGLDLLENHCKDLNVLLYTTTALATQEGIVGMLKGLKLLQAIVTSYPVGVSPLRSIARERSISALNNRLKKVLNVVPTNDIDLAQLKVLDELCTEIDNFTEESDELGVKQRFFGSLLQRVRQRGTDLMVAQRVVEPEPKKSPPRKAQDVHKEMPQSTPDAGSGGDLPATPAVVSRGSVLELSKGGEAYIFSVADQLRTLNAGDPHAYRLPRLWIWMRLVAPESGAIPAPPNVDDVLTQLETARANGQWEQVVDISNREALSRPFWLSLNRVVAEGLANLGHSTAADAIALELNALLERLPELANTTFAKDFPMLDSEATNWLEKVKGSRDGSTSSVSLDTSEQVIIAAREKIAAKEIDAALMMLAGQELTLRARRDQFLWRVEQLKIMTSVALYAAATAQLDKLDREIDEFNLEVWEPDLVLTATRAAIELKTAAAKVKSPLTELAPLLDSATARLWRLDPAAALKLPR
ncbi:MAG: TssA family type VI secretion system protein [Pseudomonadota bacterium]